MSRRNIRINKIFLVLIFFYFFRFLDIFLSILYGFYFLSYHGNMDLIIIQTTLSAANFIIFFCRKYIFVGMKVFWEFLGMLLRFYQFLLRTKTWNFYANIWTEVSISWEVVKKKIFTRDLLKHGEMSMKSSKKIVGKRQILKRFSDLDF